MIAMHIFKNTMISNYLRVYTEHRMCPIHLNPVPYTVVGVFVCFDLF